MFQKGAWPNQRVICESGWSALAAAVGHSDQQMVELFLDHGVPIQGTGALILAALTGNEENVKCLLGRGANVNDMVLLSDITGDRANVGSPLHKAVEKGHVGVVDIQLDVGADVTLRDSEGRTAVEIARQKRIDATILARLT